MSHESKRNTFLSQFQSPFFPRQNFNENESTYLMESTSFISSRKIVHLRLEEREREILCNTCFREPLARLASMIGEQEPAFSFRRSFRERHGFVARPSNGSRRTVSKRSLFHESDRFLRPDIPLSWFFDA